MKLRRSTLTKHGCCLQTIEAERKKKHTQKKSTLLMSSSVGGGNLSTITTVLTDKTVNARTTRDKITKGAKHLVFTTESGEIASETVMA